MTDQETIDRLESENARLQRQLGTAGVRQLPTADLPCGEELAMLRAMVLRVHPTTLTCTIDEFERAIRYFAFARRQPEPNNQFYPVFWLDAAREFLARNGYANAVSLRALVAAAIASGVTYTPLTRWPYDIELGLTRGDASKPSNAWREVLKRGKIPDPTPLKRQLLAAEPTNMIERDPVRGPRGLERQ
jgi:hypothetical protein